LLSKPQGWVYDFVHLIHLSSYRHQHPTLADTANACRQQVGHRRTSLHPKSVDDRVRT
jgi:hypothetical protein